MLEPRSDFSPEQIELWDLLENPPRDFTPTPLWWWSGEKVTKDRLRWQMEKFAEGGIFALVIINLAPAGPIYGAPADDPAWFSEEWWHRFEDACQIAEELQMKIYFYDQVGFSGANIQGRITQKHPEFAGQSIRLSKHVVENGQIEISNALQPLAYFDSNSSRIELDASQKIALADGSEISVVSSSQTAFDYLNPAACAALIDYIHGEFERRVGKYFGNVIAGSFQDELPATNMWAENFAAEFLKRKGYDLLDHLPALWSTSGTQSAKIKGDYYEVRSALTEEALFKPLGTWHDERNMIIGSDQSNPARAGNPTQATQIYSDYFKTHRWYSAAGSDHEGDSKVHSSLAHLYNHEKVWIESFHSSGWGGTLEETWDWLIPFLRSGANLYNPHASYYSTRAGWFEWAPPSTDWRQPYWAQYPEFSKAVRRVASVCSWGSFVAATAVLHPTANAQAFLPLDLPVDHFGQGLAGEGFEELDRAQDTYLTLVGANNWFRTRPGELDKAGIAFEIIDDASLQRATLGNSEIDLGTAKFNTILVPAMTAIEEQTARQLVLLLENGGRVLFVGSRPKFASGQSGADSIIEQLALHPRAEFFADAGLAVKSLAALNELVATDVPVLTRQKNSQVVTFIPGAFPSATGYPLRDWGDPWLWDDFDFDIDRYAKTRNLRINGPALNIQAIDASSNARLSFETLETSDQGTVIAVDTHGSPAIFVTWQTVAGKASSELKTDTEVLVAELSEWSGRLVPTLDNTWGDFALPAGSSPATLEAWDLEYLDSDTWLPTRARVGQQLVAKISKVGESNPILPEQAAEICAGLAALPADGWTVLEFSKFTGLARDPGLLGGKGYIPEEFVAAPCPGEGEVVVIRTIVKVSPGEYDLVVSASSEKKIYWNGLEVGEGDGYTKIARIQAGERNLLEYTVAEADLASPFVIGEKTSKSAFLLVEPDGYGLRPDFMTSGLGSNPTSPTVYTHDFEISGEILWARLIIGAATGLTVAIDGVVLARQEKVEYYEGSWGANPMFFEHDVRAKLNAGSHKLSITTDSADLRDVVFVDFVVQAAQTMIVVSGHGWQTSSGVEVGSSRLHRGRWLELKAAHAAVRTHPLKQASWLNGPVEIGAESQEINCSAQVEQKIQKLRLLLPAGTSRVQLPVIDLLTAEIAGQPVNQVDGTIEISRHLDAPAWLEFTASGMTAGDVLTGPVTIEAQTSPIELKNWEQIGLGSWSGGVEYRSTASLGDASGNMILDLGELRGSVRVHVNGEQVGERFCSPWRIDLGEQTGDIELSVTVYNTLAPFLSASTATTWAFPSQFKSGLFGPVTVKSLNSQLK